jgi:DNA-binding NtrC family response regulator
MKKRILVADDDASVRKMLGRVLEVAGHTALLASNGPEAILKFNSGHPHLVILDLRFPEQDAWETFVELRRLDPLAPVIMITAWPNQAEKAIERGIDALMEKPLDLPLLLQTIDRLLEEPEQARQNRHATRHALIARSA